MGIAYGANYGRPSLDLNFARNKSLIDTISGQNLVTFSRPQANYRTTYVGSDGLIKYASADEPRFDHDPLTGECLGLLIEESRTNNVTFSATQSNYNLIGTATAAASSTVAPDATNNTCIRVQGSALNDGISKVTSIITSGNHFPTVYARSRTGLSQDVKITQSGVTGPTITLPADGSWIRVTGQVSNLGSGSRDIRILQATANSIDIDVWGFQTELGAFPTSYIPTTESTVTRSADEASITGTNFSRWYNQSEGSFVSTAGIDHAARAKDAIFSAENASSPTSNHLISYIDDNGPNRAGIRIESAGSVLVDGWIPGTLVSFSKPVAIDYSSTGRVLANNQVLSSGGELVPTSINSVKLGSSAESGITPLNGHISRLTYYPTRLQDFQLQQLTK